MAHAAPPAPGVQAEIEALLGRLESSKCEFNRNGGWYNGADAKTHLHGKLESLERRTTLRSTEQFIELAATFSSSSGKPYEVKCGGGPSVPSAQWLTKELAILRAAGQRPASAPK